MNKKFIIIFNVIATLIAIAITVIYVSKVVMILPVLDAVAAGAFILILWIFVVALWVIGREIGRR